MIKNPVRKISIWSLNFIFLTVNYTPDINFTLHVPLLSNVYQHIKRDNKKLFTLDSSQMAYLYSQEK